MEWMKGLDPNALNNAAWKMTEAMEGIDRLSGKHFNNMKACLAEAVRCYLDSEPSENGG